VFIRDGLDDIPKTGDAGIAWIWWAMLAVSGAGIITLALTKKKVFQKR
jgi:LPXTG-motif cell wall-anchored protein